MKLFFLTLIVLSNVVLIQAQTISSAVEIITTYSQNGRFYLRSVPYDNESPSLKGKTSVYEKDNPKPLYVFERSFDSVEKNGNNLILSNNGEVIFYAISWGANENKEGLKSVTIYKHGMILRSFTKAEITKCNEAKERCSLLYSNYEAVVDKDKSNWGTGSYKKVFKQGTDEKEKFLSDFPIFSFEDIVYLTDSKKKVHLFSLKEGSYVGSEFFENIFGQLKTKGRFSRTGIQRLDAPIFSDFPNLRNGANVYQSLAAKLEMKQASIVGTKDDAFKIYRLIVSGFITQDGSAEIEKIEADEELPKEKILAFFNANKFNTKTIPKEFEKWYFGDEYFYFRKSDDRMARQEKRQEEIKQRTELQKRLVAEKIGDINVPKDLGECFTELDSLLKEVDKKEMQALPKKEDMIRYHMGLGMWMRNTWGLWSGSRLQKYFTDKGVNHPDNMSSVILFFYYDWLNGKKETWKDWEKKPKDVL